MRPYDDIGKTNVCKTSIEKFHVTARLKGNQIKKESCIRKHRLNPPSHHSHEAWLGSAGGECHTPGIASDEMVAAYQGGTRIPAPNKGEHTEIIRKPAFLSYLKFLIMF